MKLTKKQKDIISNSTIKENKFYLNGSLERKEYLDIVKVLEAIDLKWNRKEKAHVYSGENPELLKEAIDNIIKIGEVETIKETIKRLQFYPTPEKVVNILLKVADIREGETVLEPSAGRGNIASFIDSNNKLLCIELDSENIKYLKEKGFNCIQGDYLKTKIDKVDKIVANPPFSKSQDVKHILKMYYDLKPGGVLVSIAPISIMTKSGKLYEEVRSLEPTFIEVPKNSFKESGTLVNTIIVAIKKEV